MSHVDMRHTEDVKIAMSIKIGVLVETCEGIKILLKEEGSFNRKNILTQTVPFQPESQQNERSFQTLQSRNRELLKNCAELHGLMSTNRHNKLHAQQQLSSTYRELAKNATDCAFPDADKSVLQKLRQRISDLEEEHVSLHQNFIKQQSNFRQTVRDQRRNLVDSINRTRALTSSLGSGLALVSSISLGEMQNNNDAFDDHFDSVNARKTA